MADASRQLCPARRAGVWALTAFRALQNALGSVAPSGGACGAPYAPPPDLPEERGGWRWRGVWRLRHIQPLQFSKGAVLNTGEACGGFASAYANAAPAFYAGRRGRRLPAALPCTPGRSMGINGFPRAAKRPWFCCPLRRGLRRTVCPGPRPSRRVRRLMLVRSMAPAAYPAPAIFQRRGA